jgi:hypothetical protein
VLLCALTTSGCGPGWLVGADTPDWSAPLVTVDSALRCPEADPALRREARSLTGPPVPDIRDADGTPAVSNDALKRKVDEFRVSQVRKNKALSRALDEHDRCRTGSDPSPKIASR